MADDSKRDEAITVKVTERVLLDLNRLAARDERSLSEFIYLTLRHHLYGNMVQPDAGQPQQTTSDKVNRHD